MTPYLSNILYGLQCVVSFSPGPNHESVRLTSQTLELVIQEDTQYIYCNVETRSRLLR